MKRIYLDYAATTPVDPAVLRTMQPYFTEKFGNPGSLHSFGQEAIAAIDRSRETIAKLIGAEFREIIFTSSATEANNLALRGIIKKARQKILRPRIIISAIEHESMLETAHDLERDGVEVIYVSVSRQGIIDLKKLKASLDERTVLVSIMYANNETGTMQPVAEIAKMIGEVKNKKLGYPLFHTDAAQAFQFLNCNVQELGVDLMTLSSHKIYGPKGAAALYIRGNSGKTQDAILHPLTLGGGQEYGLRSGTENVPAVVGFAKAAELAVAVRAKESKRIEKLRTHFWRGIKKIYPKAELNDGESLSVQRLPSILSVYFPAHAAQDLLTKFDIAGLAASSGSACRSRAFESSYVIEALGYPKSRARSSVRFSLGRPTTAGEIAEALKIMKLFSSNPRIL
jgi:cysteine desulfurase